jgi:hypothetical protein
VQSTPTSSSKIAVEQRQHRGVSRGIYACADALPKKPLGHMACTGGPLQKYVVNRDGAPCELVPTVRIELTAY